MRQKITFLLALTASCSATSEQNGARTIAVDAPGSPKALECRGVNRQLDVAANGRFSVSEYPGHSVYVFDDTRRTIFVRSNADEGEDFHNFCDLNDCNVEVTPQAIRGVMVDGPGGVFDDRRKEITLERNTGRIFDVLRVKNRDGSENVYNRELSCSQVEVPLNYRARVGPPRF